MGLFRRIWAVLLGTGVGIILGILFDWLSQNGFIPLPEDSRFIVYPWIAGGAALIGALIAAIMIRQPATGEKQAVRQDSRKARPQKTRQESRPAAGSQPLRGGTEIGSSKLDSIKLEPVEGMPGFDLHEGESSPASDPKEKSSR